jgi:hypothetical protein
VRALPCNILDGHGPMGNALRPNSRSTGYHLMKVFNLNILWEPIDLFLTLEQRGFTATKPIGTDGWKSKRTYIKG